MGGTYAPRVLIADSDPHVRQQLFSALLAADVFTDCVGTVPEALARLRSDTYGVVLIDVHLPGGDPEQLVSRIAELQHGQRPVVLVVASNPAAARSLDVDVVQIVLRKPMALRQTVDLIRSCIQSATAQLPATDVKSDQPMS